jgi:hypothetical protein
MFCLEHCVTRPSGRYNNNKASGHKAHSGSTRPRKDVIITKLADTRPTVGAQDPRK